VDVTSADTYCVCSLLLTVHYDASNVALCDTEGSLLYIACLQWVRTVNYGS